MLHQKDWKNTCFLQLTKIYFLLTHAIYNSSLDELVKNLLDDNFKFLSHEFMGKLFRLAKQRGVYSYEYIDSFKRFSDDELPDRFEFFSSLKDECISEKRLFACY